MSERRASEEWREHVDEIERVRLAFPLGDSRRDEVLVLASRVAGRFARFAADNDKLTEERDAHHRAELDWMSKASIAMADNALLVEAVRAADEPSRLLRLRWMGERINRRQLQLAVRNYNSKRAAVAHLIDVPERGEET